MPFTGFAPEGIRFFKELAVRQDRDWFKAHKDDYVRLWEAPMKALKRVPPPYAADHPRARLLKMKGVGIMFPKVPAAVRSGPKLAKWIVQQSALAAPVITWLEGRLS